MARTKQTVRLSRGAAAVQLKAVESGAEVCLRYNLAVDLVAVSGEDAQEEEEVMELHLAEERHVAIRGLVAGGSLAAVGGKVVGLVLVVPSMVYTLLINTLQVINSIWGKWPHQNPPEVSYVLLVPTLSYPQHVSPYAAGCAFGQMDEWAAACATTMLEPVSLDAILPRAPLNRLLLLHRALRLSAGLQDQRLGVVSRDHLFWAPLSTLCIGRVSAESVGKRVRVHEKESGLCEVCLASTA